MVPGPELHEGSTEGAHQRPSRSRYLQWVPTDEHQVRTVEQRLLSGLSYTQRSLSGINTISTPCWDCSERDGGKKHTVVLIHGFADGVGSWAKNWEYLSRNYNVHAIDLPGFGRSLRERRLFGSPHEAMRYYHDALHNWFGEVGIPPNQPITVVGHSFGGYVSTRYTMEMLWRKRKLEDALEAPVTEHNLLASPLLNPRTQEEPSSFFKKYFVKARSTTVSSESPPPMTSWMPTTNKRLTPPPNIVQLVLADPWGVPPAVREQQPMNIRRKVIFHMFYRFAPLATLRYAGPWGPSLLERMRPDYANRWNHLPDPYIYYDYKYHTNAQLPPTGELAFQACCEGMAFAKEPLLEYFPRMLRRISTGIDSIHHDDVTCSKPPSTSLLHQREATSNDMTTTPAAALPSAVPQGQRRTALRHLTLLYGEETWMDTAMYQQLMDEVRRDGTVGSVHMDAITKAGHQLNADNADEFNVKLSEAIRRGSLD
ncbi:Hypothetical protein, putative [Bodo saltans]|uniref:AB hydrolase-1 domain-containing protein n=1 Tax=Bodo saltans TaxID=75058 RepID=A0A0S4JMQ9_BODSA|nr:Hypothetical protein, putative [Bodo saltans]|eukprot:CUG91429.1 Hypothetical protein, putative [Bodo saltans]